VFERLGKASFAIRISRGFSLDIVDLFVVSEATRPLVGPVAGIFIDVDWKPN
jgi:hypothetical protein